MGKIIGIDLGTSNSAASVMIGGKPTIIQAAEGTSVGGKAFPSYVAFTKDGQLLVGEPARRQMVTNPEGTVIAAKRKMGTDFKFKVYDKEYTPQQISSFILQKIKRDSEAYIGETVDKAVITVPAYFNDNQRQATKDAGEIAGLQVVRIINEPTAASLAYGLDKAQKDLKIMVFGLGGGTLDVTIMEMGGGVFQVKSTSGDTQLGGTDMDNSVVEYIIQEFKNQTSIDIRNDKAAMMRIKEAAEKAKIELSNVMSTEVNLPFLSYDPSSGPKNLVMTLSRSKLEELLRPIIERSTTIPTKKSKVFTTAADYQTAVTIHIVQGERSMAADCVSLGMFNLSGIPPAPRGIPQVEVTFDIDANGILNVTAKDLATSKESKITISANTKLSKDDIERLKKESDQFAEQDKKKKDEAEVKNEADNLTYTAEKLTQQDLKDKIKPEQVEKVNNAVKELKETMSSNNIEEIKKKIESLKNILGEISTEVYKSAGAAASQQATSSQNSENA